MRAAYHAPGTVMNNQFRGPNAWGDYLTALEQPMPTEAIAVIGLAPTVLFQNKSRHYTGFLRSAARKRAKRLLDS